MKKYVVRIRGNEYLLELVPNWWSRFTPYIVWAQRFDTIEDAEKAKSELCDDKLWCNFAEWQVEIVPVDN